MTSAPAAGWYNDPNDPRQSRFFDGTAWTNHTGPGHLVLNVPEARAAQQQYAAAPQQFAGAPVASGLTADANYTGGFMRLVAYLLEFLLVTVTLGIGWLIWAAITASSGQTPAKRLMGQRVVSSSTMQPVGFAKMFWVRGLLCAIIVPVLLTVSLGILLLMPFWDRANQNLWDKISGTYVVNG